MRFKHFMFSTKNKKQYKTKQNKIKNNNISIFFRFHFPFNKKTIRFSRSNLIFIFYSVAFHIIANRIKYIIGIYEKSMKADVIFSSQSLSFLPTNGRVASFFHFSFFSPSTFPYSFIVWFGFYLFRPPV